jgi:hypothetical protein
MNQERAWHHSLLPSPFLSPLSYCMSLALTLMPTLTLPSHLLHVHSQATKGFLHKMRKPGRKKADAATMAAEVSLVDRSQFFDRTSLEFEAADDQMSELSSEATDVIYPPSIVLGGIR